MSALKRIEDSHQRDVGCQRDGPCDVVRLARVLNEVLSTYGPVRPLSGTTWAKAKRTLEEVAGEPVGKVEE